MIQSRWTSEESAAKPAFFASLALLTFLPLAGIPLAQLAGAATTLAALPAVIILLALTGVGHVAATAYFYFDEGFKGIIREAKWRFVAMPFALALAFGLFASFPDPKVRACMMMGYFSWQLYHYQRQNYGLLAFTALSAGKGSPPRAIRFSFNLAVVAGVIGAAGPQGLVARLFPEALATPVDPLWQRAALAVYVLAVVSGVWVVRTYGAFFRSWLVSVCTLAGLAFFLPAVVSRDPFVTFWSYAIAHGAQYFLLMGVLSNGARRRVFLLFVLTAVTLGLTVVFLWMKWKGGFLEGAYTGLVTAHFVIDSKTWRLRESAQGALVKERFGFLF